MQVESVDTLIQHVSRAFGMGSSQNTYLVFNGMNYLYRLATWFLR